MAISANLACCATYRYCCTGRTAKPGSSANNTAWPTATTRFPSKRERDFHLDQTSTGLELNAQWRGQWLGAEHWQIFGIDAARHEYSSIRYGTETNLHHRR